SRYMVLTLPFVIYGIFRYLYLVHVHEKGGSPTKDLLTDPPLLLSIFLWTLTSVGLIYFI
ncbi:MAG: decaprenyl-phosphate phosphoribosyltransferase, partial [bacterium]